MGNRHKEFVRLLDKHRSNNKRYDCIVPGSGGKDSVYASHILKYDYGMNPLTITWPPILYTSYGYKNFLKIGLNLVNLKIFHLNMIKE